MAAEAAEALSYGDGDGPRLIRLRFEAVIGPEDRPLDDHPAFWPATRRAG